MKPNRTPDDQWNRDRARIHALLGQVKKAQPGYSDDNYRDTILDVSHGRADSSKDLSEPERRELIERLSTLAGEKPAPRKPWGKQNYPGRPKNMNKPGQSRDEQLGKIEALLTVGKKEWRYADSIAKNMKLADLVAWVETKDLYKVITALRKQAQREGWDLSGENHAKR